MGRTTKIILVVSGLVVFSCVLLCGASVLLLPRLASNFADQSTDPTKAKGVGAKIADYTLPSGYREVFGMDLFMMQMVGIGPSTQRSGMVIMLMQTASGSNREQMEEQMRQAFSRQFSSQRGTLEYVGDRDVTVKGEQIKLSISESQSTTPKMRQASGVFKGKAGTGIIMVMGSVSEWNWNILDTFFASMR